MVTVGRISRHPVTEAHYEYLSQKLGDDVEIVTEDVVYGDDPVNRIVTFVKKTGAVAVEISAPFPVLIRVVGDRDIPVPLLRPCFLRGDDGRIIVSSQDESGRDIFVFSHYEVLKRIVFDTEEY